MSRPPLLLPEYLHCHSFYLLFKFLAVQNSSIGDLVTHWLTDWLRVLLLLTLQSDPRDLWPLRHLIRVMGRHDLTEKDLPTYRVPFFRKSQTFPKNSKFSETLWNRVDFIDVPLEFKDSWVRFQPGPWNGPIFITCGHFGTVRTSLMHPWLVEITRLESPQGSAGQLQSLWKSYTMEEISFWYRNPAFFA